MGFSIGNFSPGHFLFLLELDGVSAGDVKNVQGGDAVAEVVQEMAGADHIVRKHISTVRYGDIVLTCGAGLSKAFYDWVNRASTMQGVRHDGAVIVSDYSNKEISRLEWSSGQITEIAFPALDAASKDSFSMTIKISPERTRRVKGDGSQSAVPAKAQKNWLASNFRLTIDGLDCTHVSRIEPIALAWKAQKNTVGQMRDYEVVLTNADPRNLVITLSEAFAKGFYDWFDDFVIKGNSGQDKEKSGKLESGPFSLKFGNLGPVRMTGASDRPGAMIRKSMAEMYCESIQFSASSTG